jgi:nucleotide-binding universal stress UspA family protein
MSEAEAPRSGMPRVFLVIVDDTPEMSVALNYAARRAVKTGGRVALLYVIPPHESHGLLSVEALIREEARQEAEQLLQRLAKTVMDETGALPVVHLREGLVREELLALIDEDPTISILVLAAGTGPEGPGPLVTFLASKGFARLRIPVTIVPGSLTRAQLDTVA